MTPPSPHFVAAVCPLRHHANALLPKIGAGIGTANAVIGYVDAMPIAPASGRGSLRGSGIQLDPEEEQEECKNQKNAESRSCRVKQCRSCFLTGDGLHLFNIDAL